ILDAIEKLDYDVFNNRAYVSRWMKLLDLPRSYLIAQTR
ncbi:MAG: phytoene synthase, partial [Prochlorococcus sp.]